MLAVGTQTASAQAIIVTTPFAFSAGNEGYPAGTYEFSIVSAWSLSIRNVNGGGEKFFVVRPQEKGSRGSRASVVFDNSEGHKNLQAIYFPGTGRGGVLLQTNKVKRHVSGAATTMAAEKPALWKQNVTVQ
jgi:hypothetical protein